MHCSNCIIASCRNNKNTVLSIKNYSTLRCVQHTFLSQIGDIHGYMSYAQSIIQRQYDTQPSVAHKGRHDWKQQTQTKESRRRNNLFSSARIFLSLQKYRSCCSGREQEGTHFACQKTSGTPCRITCARLIKNFHKDHEQKDSLPVFVCSCVCVSKYVPHLGLLRA